MSIKFPYHYKKIDFGKVPEPTVDLEVETNQGWQKIKFLVDSGADATTLPLFLASEWGIEVDSSKRIQLGGVEGRGVTGYPAKIKIRIGEEEEEIRCYFIESETPPLLGRVDVWEKFKIIFDNQNQEVVLEKIGERECWLTHLIKQLKS